MEAAWLGELGQSAWAAQLVEATQVGAPMMQAAARAAQLVEATQAAGRAGAAQRALEPRRAPMLQAVGRVGAAGLQAVELLQAVEPPSVGPWLPEGLAQMQAEASGVLLEAPAAA